MKILNRTYNEHKALIDSQSNLALKVQQLEEQIKNIKLRERPSEPSRAHIDDDERREHQTAIPMTGEEVRGRERRKKAYDEAYNKYTRELEEYNNDSAVKSHNQLRQELSAARATLSLATRDVVSDIVLEQEDLDGDVLREEIKSQLKSIRIKDDQVEALPIVMVLKDHIERALKNTQEPLYPSEIALLKACQDKLQTRNPPVTRLGQVSHIISNPSSKKGWREKFARFIDMLMNLIKPQSKRQEPRFKKEIGAIKGKLGEKQPLIPKSKSPGP